jgi:hypothetical protein
MKFKLTKQMAFNEVMEIDSIAVNDLPRALGIIDGRNHELNTRIIRATEAMGHVTPEVAAQVNNILSLVSGIVLPTGQQAEAVESEPQVDEGGEG